MEITDRKENPILNRVELTWQWRHTGAATPTRNEIIDAVVKMEPGATKDRVLVKSVSTRFGQPLTTGNAFVYGDRADLEKEPKIHSSTPWQQGRGYTCHRSGRRRTR